MTLEEVVKKTIKEKYEAATRIKNQKDADEYFESLVKYSMKSNNISLEKAVIIEKQNLNYYAGYFDDSTRLRVLHLFKCHETYGVIRKVINRKKSGLPQILGHKHE
jgi:hypothetical protein